ncbi:tetratricopeptide repeat protein [Ottowia pentelensis]|uniref:Tetratricopeptide repeat protein n=1 Tax=Ottowia pentelensis TaxID=511108 RepID=A0ABV6PN76_9BURK
MLLRLSSLSTHRPAVLALLLACLLLAGSARAADDYTQVQQLQSAGQTAQALAAADAYIKEHPRDPQMRFIKANVLSASGQAAEAQALLLQLTRDYPELAEPWNNLAVLYAAGGHLAQAREALQNALRVQPDYATALANLGDVQAREALQSFERARQAKADDPQLPAKIEALHGLWGAAPKPAAAPKP